MASDVAEAVQPGSDMAKAAGTGCTAALGLVVVAHPGHHMLKVSVVRGWTAA